MNTSKKLQNCRSPKKSVSSSSRIAMHSIPARNERLEVQKTPEPADRVSHKPPSIENASAPKKIIFKTREKTCERCDRSTDAENLLEIREKLQDYGKGLDLNEMQIDAFARTLEECRVRIEEKERKIKELEEKLAKKETECYVVKEKCKLFEMQLEEVERMTEPPSTVEQGVQVDMDEPKLVPPDFEKGGQEIERTVGQGGIEGNGESLLARDALDGHGRQDVKEEDPEEAFNSFPSTSTANDCVVQNSANWWPDSGYRNSSLWHAEVPVEKAQNDHQRGSLGWNCSWSIPLETTSSTGISSWNHVELDGEDEDSLAVSSMVFTGNDTMSSTTSAKSDSNQGVPQNTTQVFKNENSAEMQNEHQNLMILVKNIFERNSENRVKEESAMGQGAVEEAVEVAEEHMEVAQDGSRMANNEVMTSCYDEALGTPPVHENTCTWNKPKRRRRSGGSIGRLLFTCPVNGCSSSYSTDKKLEEHLNSHPETVNLFCDVCKRSFSSKDSAMEHIGQRTQYECCQCGKTCSTAIDIRRHLRTHTGEKPYICEICGQGFSMLHSMHRHIELMHNGEKSYPCRYCQRRFAWQHQLQEHEQLHVTVHLRCSRCDYICEDRVDMRNHMRIHASDRRFECSYCGKEFKRKSCLVSHTRRHTGEKPYSCTKCGAKFAHNCSLKNHMKKHNN